MKNLALFFLVVIAQPALALEPNPEPSKKGSVEIGGVAGYPVGVGLVVGYWGPRDFPLLARIATGVGTTVEVGMAFSNEDNLMAYVSLSGGMIGYLNVFNEIHYYIGPTVGLRINKMFSLGLGPAARFKDSAPAALMITGYVGVSGLF